jgi:hypothetical protein
MLLRLIRKERIVQGQLLYFRSSRFYQCDLWGELSNWKWLGEPVSGRAYGILFALIRIDT